MGNLGNLVTRANGYHVPNKRPVTTTLQISNGPVTSAMTPLQPLALAQKRLETHFFDQCHGCYGWVWSDVVKEFQGIFVLPIADVALQCLCCQSISPLQTFAVCLGVQHEAMEHHAFLSLVCQVLLW